MKRSCSRKKQAKTVQRKKRAAKKNYHWPEDGLARMVEIERFIGRLTEFLHANGVVLQVERKSDHSLTTDDEQVRLVFQADGQEVRITEHTGDFMEAFLWPSGAERTEPHHPEWGPPEQGPRVTGHVRPERDIVAKIGYIA